MILSSLAKIFIRYLGVQELEQQLAFRFGPTKSLLNEDNMKNKPV